jgi:adenosylcobinamide-phosphate synthase
MSVIAIHFYLIITAIIIDLLIGDPRWLPHPVIIMGKVISFLEKMWNREKFRKVKGMLLTLTVVGGAYIFVFGLLKIVNYIHPYATFFVEMYLISTTIAMKGLHKAAKEVANPLLQGDLSLAREKLSFIVGRDTEELPTDEVVRGTVETVAENTVDAIIAPLCWALIGGAPLAMAYRAVNTLDSMVGYKNEKYKQFGWGSARLDDVMNWIPARLTAILIWLFSWFVPNSKKWNAIVVTVRDAKKHPSPNSGWPEAMTAGLLGVVLGGKNRYQGVVSNRAEMGNYTRRLQPKDIQKTIIYMHGAWFMFVLILFFIYMKL